MADGGVKIEVGLNTSKAEKDLARLKDKINKAEEQLNKSTGKRDAISERLDAATQKAETARQKIAELNEELAKGKGGGQIDTRKIDEALAAREKLAKKLTQIDMKDYYAKLGDLNIAKGEQFDLQNKIGKLEHLSAQGAITPENYAAELAKLQGPLDTVNEKVRQLSDELKQIGDASGYNEVKQKMKDLDLYITQMQHKATPTPLDPNEVKKATEEIAEQEKVIKGAEKEAEKLKTEFEKIDEKVKDGEKSLEDMKKQAGKMVESIERARPGETLAKGFDMAKKSAMKFLKYAIGIRSVFFLWRRLRSYISDAVSLYAEYDKETKYNLALMEATKKAIQGTFGSAFTQIYTALLPVIQRIANWMLEAANAAARFIAILSGKGSYKKAVVDVAEVEKSIADAAEDANDEIEDTTDAAKELQRTLAPIDELNILNGDSGGGSGKKEKEAKEKISKTDLDGIKFIEETLDKLDESLLDKLALNMKDVLFNWDDLNPEQIAKKFIAGLGAVLGGALGLALGLGSGGVLMLTLGGLLLGLLIDSLIFDNDGRLSEHEIVSMIIIALGALVGGIIGFAAGGGFKGALIGAWIGAGIGLLIQQLLVKKGASLTIDNLLKTLVPILNAMIGGAVGGMLGLYFTASPAGAAAGAVIGAVIGAGLTMIFKSITAKSGTKGKAAMDKIAKVLTLATGGLIGFMIGGGVGAVIGTIAAAIVIAITSIALNRDSKNEDFQNSQFAKEAEEVKERLENILSERADLTVHINSITGEIDDATMADLAAAQSLINKIFTLDENENKTSAEIAEINGLIETLNSLGLPGVFLEFDEATSHVNGTHEAMQKVLDDLLEQYRMEAMGEAYVESIKAQWDAHQRYKDALDAGNDAAKKRADAERDLASATDEYNAALKEYDQYQNEIMSAGSGGAVSEQAQAAQKRLEDAKKSLDAAKLEIETAQTLADTAAQAIEQTYADMETTAGKVSEIETAFSDMTKNMEEDGKNAGAGWLNGWNENADEIVSESGKTSKEILAELEKPWDFGSPSKTSEQDGEWAVEGFKNGVRNKTPDAVNAVKEMMDQIFREFDTSLQKIKNLMNFSWKLPRPSIPQINYKMQSVRYGRGQSVSFPQFFVEWYAKGGVFDFPTMIGVGENGKEAVVPLEKNTEWMTKVADGLMERLQQANFANQLADAFMRTPMPAMAGGGIVPPGAVQGSAFSAEGMEAALERGVYNAMMAMGNQRNNKGSWQININGHEFMRAIWSDFKDVQSEHGISMIET